MGDPSKIVMLEALIDVIERDNLMNNVKDVGKYLLNGVKELEVCETVAKCTKYLFENVT